MTASPLSSSLSLADRFDPKAPFATLHHVALVTNDMRKTVAFYRDVLGSEIAMSHRLAREGNERHYFITVAPNVVFAFFEFPDAEMPEFQPAMIAKTGRALDHIAFLVPDENAFTSMYTRLRGQVAHLSEIRDLGSVRAFFIADPNNIVLEVMVEKGEGFAFPQLGDPDPAY